MNGMRIFLVIFLLFWVFCAITVFRSMGQRKKEKALFHKMIDNPNDSTVSTYIIALKSLNSNFMYRYATSPYNYNCRTEDRHRQAQGWNHIKNCSTVSDSKKKELKSLFNKYGASVI